MKVKGERKKVKGATHTVLFVGLALLVDFGTLVDFKN
jgi:hypothetical protein